MRYLKYILFSLTVLFFENLLGQDISKIVFVESAYRPEIESAEKLGGMPSITDTTRADVKIEYTVLPSRLHIPYEIKPIKPAKLTGSPLDELYKSQVRLGIGNYTTPLAEFSIHNLRSKEYAVGAYAFHKSSHADMKMDDGNKVPAGYGKNRLSVYGKKFYDDINVEGNVYFNSDKYRYYGYNTTEVPDTHLEAKTIRQYYTKLGGKVQVYSTEVDSNAFQYRLGIDAGLFADDYKNHENSLKIPAYLAFNIKDFRLGVDVAYDFYARKYDSLSNNNEQVFLFKPVLQKRKDDWEVNVGGNLVYNNNKTHFYPIASLRFAVIEKVMNAYVGFDGNLEINTHEKIAFENPYVQPGLKIGNTNNKLTGYGGIEGLLSSKSGYKAEISFNTINNAYFFINDTSDILGNKFIAVYDDIELLKLRGELWYSPFSYLSFYLKAANYSYNMSAIDKPWHKPAYDISLISTYNFKQKIFASFNLIQYGKRYAYNYSAPTNPLVLDPIWDINLKLEYKYSEVLSGFIDGYNLLSKKYYLWNQYPSQKINVMVGFSYKF